MQRVHLTRVVVTPSPGSTIPPGKLHTPLSRRWICQMSVIDTSRGGGNLNANKLENLPTGTWRHDQFPVHLRTIPSSHTFQIKTGAGKKIERRPVPASNESPLGRLRGWDPTYCKHVFITGWSCQCIAMQWSLVDLPSSPLPCRPVLPHGLSGRLAPSTSYSPSWLTLFTWLTCLLLILIPFHLVLPDKGHRNQGVEGWLSQALVTKVGEVSLANLETF